MGSKEDEMIDISKVKVPYITQVVPQEDMLLVATFADGTVKQLDMKQYDYFSLFKPLFEDPQIFKQAHTCDLGAAVAWTDEIDLSRYEIWLSGVTV